MVHVTKTNFLTQLTDFLHHLPTASFIAIDEEMTGISLPGSRQRRPNKIELPGERYERQLKGVPERYSILQVGVALFCKNPNYRKDRADSSEATENNNEDDENNASMIDDREEEVLTRNKFEVLNEGEEEDGDDNEEGTTNGDEENSTTNDNEEQSEYTSRIYNFYLFPSGKSDRDREVTLSPSAVKFLLENHMDFEKVFREGIPFTTVERATYLKNRYFEKYNPKKEVQEQNGKENGSSNTPRKNRVKLSRVEDISFVARTMAGLREWIDSDNSLQNPLAGEDGQAVAVAAAAEATNGNAAAIGENNNGTNGTNPNGNGGPNHQAEGTSLVLPPCNAFLRRCLYETIEDEYPGLILEKAGTDQMERNQIRVIRLSPMEKKRREVRLRQENWDNLLHDIGFTVLFQAISDACNGKSFSKEQTSRFLDGLSPELSTSIVAENGNGEQKTGRKIPLVIHNGLHDLMFLLTHCHNASLPESFEDTKKIIRGYFPVVCDTKVLATEYSDAIIKTGKTYLEELFNTTCGVNGDTLSLKVPPVVNQDGKSQGQAHEAAWDAYMTGCVFNALCNRILESKNRPHHDLTLERLLHDSSHSLLREWVGMNMIYMHVSLYTIDLESSSGLAGLHDPLSRGLSIDTTFYVSGITKSVSTRDIFQALAYGNESEDEAIRLLEYEILWVDDTSFFAGARIITTNDVTTTGLIASHIRNKLYAGLGKVEILPLGDYFKNKNDDVPETCESGGIVASLVSVATKPFRVLGSVLGFGKRPSDDNGSSEGASKRRRLN